MAFGWNYANYKLMLKISCYCNILTESSKLDAATSDHIGHHPPFSFRLGSINIFLSQMF